MSLDAASESADRGPGDPTSSEELHRQIGSLPLQARASLEFEDLLRLQSRLVSHYFRLQKAERRLSGWLQAMRPAAGLNAVRQIEKERERLGRDLHTGVGQLLAAIRLQLEVIAAQLPSPPAAVQSALDRIARLANDAGDQVRALSHQLHPPEWQRLSLEAAIRQLWEASGIPQRFEGSLRIDPLLREPEQEAKVLVYRATQEALTNLVRHAQASHVEIALRARAGYVVLTVTDDGTGFDAAGLLQAPANVAQGIGLRSIREQAAALGGRFDIASGADGTRLELSIPLELPRS